RSYGDWSSDVCSSDLKGKRVYLLCAACHEKGGAADAGAPGTGQVQQGPTLEGVVGRKSGSIRGYRYSRAMKNANLTWDEKTLDRSEERRVGKEWRARR